MTGFMGVIGVKRLWKAKKVVKEKKLALTKGGVDIESGTRGPRGPIKFLRKVLMHLSICVLFIMALHQPKQTHQHPNFIFWGHFSITEGPNGEFPLLRAQLGSFPLFFGQILVADLIQHPMKQ